MLIEIGLLQDEMGIIIYPSRAIGWIMGVSFPTGGAGELFSRRTCCIARNSPGFPRVTCVDTYAAGGGKKNGPVCFGKAGQ